MTPRYHIGLHVALRWPWHVGWDPLVRKSDEWGWCYAYDLVLGFLVLGFSVFGNPARWAGR